MSKSYLDNYYSNYDEENRLSSKQGQIEFLTTVRYVDKYLTEGMKLLEVGAGTGRYSLHFAEAGVNVQSVELIEHNIKQFQSKVKPHHKIQIHQGNAMDLNMFEDNVFDMTLVLGPLYHLFTDEDRARSINEAIRVTKPGGYIYIAYLTHDAVITNWGLGRGHFAQAIEDKMFTESYECVDDPKLLFSMFHVATFDKMMKAFSLNHLHTVATDGIAVAYKEQLNAMDERTFSEWLKYHFYNCERVDLMGYSNHVLYIGQKK